MTTRELVGFCLFTLFVCSVGLLLGAPLGAAVAAGGAAIVGFTVIWLRS